MNILLRASALLLEKVICQLPSNITYETVSTMAAPSELLTQCLPISSPTYFHC